MQCCELTHAFRQRVRGSLGSMNPGKTGCPEKSGIIHRPPRLFWSNRPGPIPCLLPTPPDVITSLRWVTVELAEVSILVPRPEGQNRNILLLNRSDDTNSFSAQIYWTICKTLDRRWADCFANDGVGYLHEVRQENFEFSDGEMPRNPQAQPTDPKETNFYNLRD